MVTNVRGALILKRVLKDRWNYKQKNLDLAHTHLKQIMLKDVPSLNLPPCPLHMLLVPVLNLDGKMLMSVGFLYSWLKLEPLFRVMGSL